MKKTLIIILQLLLVLPILAQETANNTNTRNITRQGFGTQVNFDMAIGFVNPRAKTDGSAYYFDNWDTKAIIYTKNNGVVKLSEVNINLFDNTLEALFDENSIFTFDNKNVTKIIINDQVFGLFMVDGKLRILELFFKDGFSIYKYYTMYFREASPNPMLNRKENKYVKSENYYLYRDGTLTKFKLSKKSLSKLFKTDALSQKTILDYINKANLSLKNEDDFKKALRFISK